MTRRAATALLAILWAMPALAQDAPVPAAPFLTSASPDLIRISGLIGLPVFGSDLARFGTVEELVFDHDGRVVSVVIGTGGRLGSGEKRVGVPFDSVVWRAAGGGRPDANPDRVAAGSEPRPIAPQAGGSAASAQPAPAPATTTLAGSGDAIDRAVLHLSRGDLQMAPEYRYDSETEAGADP